MATSLKDLRNLTLEDKQAADGLEQWIDDCIKAGVGSKGNGNFALKLNMPKESVQQELIRRFKKAGWGMSFRLITAPQLAEVCLNS